MRIYTLLFGGNGDGHTSLHGKSDHCVGKMVGGKMVAAGVDGVHECLLVCFTS